MSQHFGTDPVDYYLKELPNFISNLDGVVFSLLGLVMISYNQLTGKVNGTSFPFLAVFVATDLSILSSVEHKE